VKVRNEDGASVTRKVAFKQLHYIPITPRLKWLFLCEETSQQMRWHKEGIHDSKDADIMLHRTDAEAWHALDLLIQNLQRDPRSVCLGLSMDDFRDAVQSASQQMFEGRVYIPYSCDSGS
jgi:hypothetical protein